MREVTAAHELGHLLLHPEAYDVQKTDEDDAEEAEADAFAGYFIMPVSLQQTPRVGRLRRLVREAVETEKITLSRAGEILQLNLPGMRRVQENGRVARRGLAIIARVGGLRHLPQGAAERLDPPEPDKLTEEGTPGAPGC